MSDSPLIRIGTHDGNFHGDDVLAVAILTTIYPHHQIIRSRDPDILDLCDILVDVGDQYDHHAKRYDHHLHNPPMDRHKHMLSSAGLIWCHYDRTYLKTIGLPPTFDYKNRTIDLMDAVCRNIHTHWIVPIDRLDNGISQGFTAISELVRSMRPTDCQKTETYFNKSFLDTVSMVSHLFKRACFHSADHIIAKTKYAMGEKMFLEEGKIVVSDHPVHGIKSLMPTPAHFIICPCLEYKDADSGYVVRLIHDPSTKQFKTPFPEQILGMRTAVIEEITSLNGISYIHHAGFMALCETEQAAIALCQYLLKTNLV